VGLLTNIKCVINETGLEVGCLAGFFHHCEATTNVHIHAYHHPLCESGTKTYLWMIIYVEKIYSYNLNIINNSNMDFSYYENWYTAG